MIQRSIQKSRVKSLTSDGEKAITRAHYYREIGKDYIGIRFSLLYFSREKQEFDDFIRCYKGKYVYKRIWTIKLKTLLTVLYDLEILKIEK